MALPFFYTADYNGEQKISLDADTSRHVIQVLRMRVGERLNLTDGKGHLLTCEITVENKKHCDVQVVATSNQPSLARNIAIAISLLKNTNRFEWFLEKATELGVREIIPLICERTEKEKFRFERLNAICISAMLQSQQCWLPVLHHPAEFNQVVHNNTRQQKIIAHCTSGDKQPLSQLAKNSFPDSLLLIGPEGDFTPKEIDHALAQGFMPVSIGETRLRTETAGVAGASLLMLGVTEFGS
jgi:16S rRNA (uracil1498-N3)-methyltransferase